MSSVILSGHGRAVRKGSIGGLAAVSFQTAQPRVLQRMSATPRQHTCSTPRHPPPSTQQLSTQTQASSTSQQAPAPSQQLLSKARIATMPIVFRAGDDKDSSSSVRRILCYGDSLTAGFCFGGQLFAPYGRALSEALGAAGVSCEVSVCGLSGKTAKEMVNSLEGTMIDMLGCRGKGLSRILEEDDEYDLVLIMTGTNDLGSCVTPPSILENTRRLHAVCHAHHVRSVALVPPPVPSSLPSFEAQRCRLAEGLRDLADTMPGVVACVDPADLVPLSTRGLWEADGLHFSPAGSRQLGERLADLSIGWAIANSESSIKSESTKPVRKTQPPARGQKSGAIEVDAKKPSREWKLPVGEQKGTSRRSESGSTRTVRQCRFVVGAGQTRAYLVSVP